MTNRSMTLTEMYLSQARKSLADVRVNVEQAQQHDPDPEITDANLYPPMLRNIDLMMLYCSARIFAGQPELEREKAT